MSDERELAIANREKIRRLYHKSQPQTDESVAEDAEQIRPQADTAAPAKPKATTKANLFGGW